MAIFEPIVMKEILGVTCSILKKNFFYEDETLGEFLTDFIDIASDELLLFEASANQEILDTLNDDYRKRLHFTCYFVSAHLREVFIHRLHFTEQEIYAFESLLPKYTGEYNRDENKQSKYKRAHHREFFE